MIENDVCIGKPLVAYSAAKATIEALASLTAGSQGYASDTHAPGWLIDDTWSWLDITKGETLTVTGSPTLAGDATLTLTTALTVNTGAGVLTFPAGGATLTIPATGTAALGTGTANYLTKWSATNTLTNSLIRDDGTTVGIGTSPLAAYLFSVEKIGAGSGDLGAGNFLAKKYRGISTDYVTGLNMATYEYANTDNGASSTCRALSVKNYYDASATYTLTISYGYGAQINTPTVSGAGTVAITRQSGIRVENQGNASMTTALGIDIADQSGAATNIALRTYAGSVIFNDDLADDADFLLNGTTYALIQTDASDDELYLCKNASAKLSFHNVTPVVQQVLATGAGKTVDEVITFLQLIGLCKQA